MLVAMGMGESSEVRTEKRLESGMEEVGGEGGEEGQRERHRGRSTLGEKSVRVKHRTPVPIWLPACCTTLAFGIGESAGVLCVDVDREVGG